MASPVPQFLEGYLPYLLRKADQALSAPFYATLTERGVSRSDWRVLAVLAEVDELSVIDLTALALSPQPTVTHAVRRLEERGLVRRSVGEQDKRQRFVSVTAAGEALTATLVRDAQELAAKALHDAGDLSALYSELERLTALVEANLDEQTSKMHSFDEDEPKDKG